MPEPTPADRESPKRWQAIAFHLKTRIFQSCRLFSELGRRPPKHTPQTPQTEVPIISEKRAPLWRDISAAEFPLTAGKVENLRCAARAFHGLEIPAGEIFSFWRQLGRTTRRKGYISGRELREGCLVPAIGGGLCQLSGLLYQAALDAGFQIIERHAHSRVVAGSTAEQDLDATVFWNYVDLRFSSTHAWQLQVELTASELVVRIRAATEKVATPLKVPTPRLDRPAPTGDCLTCGMLECFRHPAATAEHSAANGHSTYLLDARWPEFDQWCRDHAHENDRWFIPLDGRRWKKPAYQWSAPPAVRVRHATMTTLLRAFRQRHIPAQGASRQRALLRGESDLAKKYAAMLHHQCRHVVISQNLLPYLWKSGALGGRTFDVLMERLPLELLQHRLDLAKFAQPESTTLGDFRAAPEIVLAERQALAAAGRLITPHRDIAAHFPDRAWLIDWEMPVPLVAAPSPRPVIFFPASRLGRKGAFELAAALRGEIDAELKFLGKATEGSTDPFAEITSSPAAIRDLASAHLLVLPAWVEHQPRLALLALASGIPVVATRACGLPEHPLLHQLNQPDPLALRLILRAILSPVDHSCAAS